MSKLLKELEPGENQELLASLLQQTQGLERGSRRARQSSSGLSGPHRPAPPAQGIPQSNPSSTPTRKPKLRKSHAGKPAVGDSPLGPELLPGSKSDTPETGSATPKGRIQVSIASSSQQKPPQDTFTASSTIGGTTGREESLPMASQRNRPGRGGPRGATNDLTEEKDLWQQILPHLAAISKAETRAAELNREIFENEAQKKEKTNSGIKPSIEGIESLSTLYREQIRIADDQKARAQDEDLLSKISVLIGMIKHNEETMEAQPPARVGSSRNSAMDFDGPSDSPIPSPAENKQVRKIGPSRTSSQPPRNSSDIPDIAVSEANERVSKPKIVYAKDEEVAFKRKVAGGKPDEQDWILGRVMRVIGEGKSRRYEVQDPFPDEGSVNPLFKSSASQMVPIPPEGTALEDYEVGKRVLALYPDTTTFYRAEVKAMLDGGARVQLLFEDEAAGALKIVERRFVLDHKG